MIGKALILSGAAYLLFTFLLKYETLSLIALAIFMFLIIFLAFKGLYALVKKISNKEGPAMEFKNI